MDNQQDLDQTFIKDLRLSRRTFNAIHRSGIFTVGELKKLLQNNMLEKIYFVGKKSIDEVSDALDRFYRDASNPVRKERISENTFPSSGSDIDLAPVEILHLHASTRGALIKNGIKTIGDLRLATDEMLLNLNRIGPKVLIEIRQAIESVVDEPEKYIPKKTIPSQANKAIATWAEITQSYFESEKDHYTYILLSRFGFSNKKLEEIATELNITRQRVRQIQVLATVHFLGHFRPSDFTRLLSKIHKILSDYGDDLSLNKFKQKLKILYRTNKREISH